MFFVDMIISYLGQINYEHLDTMSIYLMCGLLGVSYKKPYTLRSKGAKWHLLGFFGLSLYWHPQKVLQRTPLEGSLERTLLRTLTWGSLKEPWRVLLNHKLGAAKNHLGFFIEPCAFMKGSLKNPLGIILWPWFLHWGWFKTFYDELHNYILNIYHRRKILLSSLMMLL